MSGNPHRRVKTIKVIVVPVSFIVRHQIKGRGFFVFVVQFLSWKLRLPFYIQIRGEFGCIAYSQRRHFCLKLLNIHIIISLVQLLRKYMEIFDPIDFEVDGFFDGLLSTVLRHASVSRIGIWHVKLICIE